MALTRRQREVLDFIAEFIRTRRYSPSLEEIAEHFGLSSVATVHKHVTNLEKKGFIRRDWNRSRSIDVVAETVERPAPRPLSGRPVAGSGGGPDTARGLGGLEAVLPFSGGERVAEAGPRAEQPAARLGASGAAGMPGLPGGSGPDPSERLPGAIEAIRDAFEPERGGREESPDVTRLPLQGRVAAGLPLEAVTDDETIAVPRGLSGRPGRSYVLQVHGESMIDEHVQDGDFVVVEERSTVRDGEKVIALIDGEATLKTFHREADGTVRLDPANPAFEPIHVRDGDFQVRGVVIGLLRKYRA